MFYFEIGVCATSISGINGGNSAALLLRCLSPLLNLEGKMSESSAFYLETKSIMEAAIKTAVDVIGHSKEEKWMKEQSMRRKVS